MNRLYAILLMVLLGMLGMFAIASTEPQYEQMGWYLVVVAAVLLLFRSTGNMMLRFLFLIVSAFISVRYFAFRSIYTLSFTDMISLVPAVILFIAEGYAILVHLIGIVININPTKREVPKLPSKLPSIDVFIPTYNEAEDIALTTALACKNFDYPADLVNVYILNDGGRLSILNDKAKSDEAYKRHVSLKEKAEKNGINYLTRENGDKAKAGMINDALTGKAFSDVKKNSKGLFVGSSPYKTTGDLVLILDCDHVPTTDFLQKTVGFFDKNEKLFLVQTPHYMINEEPMRKSLDSEKIIAPEGYLFYKYVQRCLDSWNAAFFCGSAAVLRRSILEENGGLEGDTITEDCETALELHSKGYDSVYLDQPLIAGLETENFESFIAQRTRWCKGMVQIFVLKNPLFKKGLSFMQRLSYLNSSLFWFFPIFRMIFLIAPLIFLYFSINIYNASFMQVINYAGPHIVSSILTMYYLYPKARSFLHSEVLETLQTIYLLPAVITTLIHPRRPTFNITPKGMISDNDHISPLVAPFAIMVILPLIGIFRGYYIYERYPLLLDAVLLTGFWNMFNLLVAIICLGVMWERKQTRKHYPITIGEEYIFFAGDKIKVSELSLSDIKLVSSIGSKVKLGETIKLTTIDGYKFSAKVKDVGKEFIAADIDNYMSKENIKYVYGDSSRWKQMFDNFPNKKYYYPIPLYLIVQGFKNSGQVLWQGVRSMFATIVLGVLLFSSTADAEVLNVKISQLMGVEQVDVDNVYSSYYMPFYVSPRWDVESASFVVFYKKASDIKPEDIKFDISLRTGELKYNHISDGMQSGKLEVEIDKKLLNVGKNEILGNIYVVDKDKSCELEHNSLVFDLTKSYLTFNYKYKHLSNVDALTTHQVFNEDYLDPVQLNLVVDTLNLESLKKSIIAASNIAIETKDRPMSLSLDKVIKPSFDNIVVSKMQEEIAPTDGHLIIPFDKIADDAVFKQNVLKQGEEYSFKELGLENMMFKRARAIKSFGFLIPSTSYLSPNKKLKMNLNLIYGNQISKKSKLDIYLNNKILAQIFFDGRYVQDLKSYEIEIQGSLLKKGKNTIAFVADLHSSVAEEDCYNPINEGVFVTMFNSSSILVPDLGTYVELPDVSLLFNDGYPQDGNTDVFISELNYKSAEAVMKMGAYISERRGTAPKGAKFFIGDPAYNGRNVAYYYEDKNMQDNVVEISQSIIPNTKHFQLDVRAKNFEVMSMAFDYLWDKEVINNINPGDTLELNIKTSSLKTYYKDKKRLIISEIGPWQNLSDFANNNINKFYVYLTLFIVVSAWLIRAISQRVNNAKK